MIPSLLLNLAKPYTRILSTHKSLPNLSQPFQNLLKGLRIRINTDLAVLPKMPKAVFYAVSMGRKPGVYTSWDDAKKQVDGFPGATHKKFNDERSARAFLSPSKPYNKPDPTASTSKPNANARQLKESSPALFADPPDLPEGLLRHAKEGYKFSKTQPYHLVVYTDGSALGNGKVGSRAGLGVWWGSRGTAERQNLAERVPGELQTNNRGELLAVIRALESCPFPDLPLEIRTDSQYSIQCITQYLPIWLRNNFKTATKTPVKNVDMIKHLLVLLRRRGKIPVKFKYVPAHQGLEGNEGADLLAKSGAMLPAISKDITWLDPDDEDARPVNNTTDIDVEIDPSFLATDEELELELA